MTRLRDWAGVRAHFEKLGMRVQVLHHSLWFEVTVSEPGRPGHALSVIAPSPKSFWSRWNAAVEQAAARGSTPLRVARSKAEAALHRMVYGTSFERLEDPEFEKTMANVVERIVELSAPILTPAAVADVDKPVTAIAS
jgi:hypothetical protein